MSDIIGYRGEAIFHISTVSEGSNSRAPLSDAIAIVSHLQMLPNKLQLPEPIKGSKKGGLVSEHLTSDVCRRRFGRRERMMDAPEFSMGHY